MIKLFTDGGSDNRGGGASACIVQHESKSYCFSYLLGDGTNNECEISAVLVGLAYIHTMFEKGIFSGSKRKIQWISDSEYSLKSATQYINTWQKNGWKTSQKDPVKNQGLWKTYLHLSRGYQIVPMHVRGHTGHPENEACDLAVNWVRKNQEDCNGDWLPGLVDIGDSLYPEWYVKDSRSLLIRMRLLDSESGMSQDDFIDYLDFGKLDTISKSLFNARAKSSEASEDDIKKERVRITKSYLKKMQELDKKFLESDSKYSGGVKSLLNWLKKDT